MPKETGFDLYALVVHYKDGNKCICYARKTDEWFYFSDKMDFRIKLADDNKTITQQEWRRKHYESSWYESGLLDYVELMQFGEEYLQSELNPMRSSISDNSRDITINRTTIERNYNEYINFVDGIMSTINKTVMNEYISTLRGWLSYNASGFLQSASDFTTACDILVANFRDLVTALSDIFANCIDWVNPVGSTYYLPTYRTSSIYEDFNLLTKDGSIETAGYQSPQVMKSVDYPVFTSSHDISTGSLGRLRAEYSALDQRITALENKRG